MQLTIELTDEEMRAVLSATGLSEERAAIRKLIDTAVLMEKRKEVLDKIASGEWGVEFEGYEESQARESAHAREMIERWDSEE